MNRNLFAFQVVIGRPGKNIMMTFLPPFNVEQNSNSEVRPAGDSADQNVTCWDYVEVGNDLYAVNSVKGIKNTLCSLKVPIRRIYVRTLTI